RITLLDVPPNAAVVLTVDGDVYEESTVVDADVLEVRPLRGLGAPLFGVAELNTYRFAAAPDAVTMWAHLRAAAMLRGVPMPASPFVLAAGVGGGAAWVPQRVQLDDPADAAAVVAAPLCRALAAALGVPAPLAAAPAAAPAAAAGNPAAAAAAAGAGGVAVADCRVHPIVRDADGRRALDFTSAALLASSTPQADWPIKGPRTTQWCLDHMRRNAGGPLAWHSMWKAEAMLRDTDSICRQHEMNCRLFEIGRCYDQVNCAEMASYELICRQIQLVEERHYEDTVTAQVAAEDKKAGKNESAKAASASLLAVEADYYMGVSASKGNL
ncbi:unnamed protein product, partial [Prorocentrum cordatum]